MTTFSDLVLMNETMIVYQMGLGIKPERNNVIKEMLKDKALFKKISKKDAFIILRDIGVSQASLETVYNDVKL